MNKHPVFGISVPEKGWAPAPRYLLRRHRVLGIMDSLRRGDLLEIGCGSGALLNDLTEMGFSCKAFEISSAALSVARYINRNNVKVAICEEIPNKWKLKFDYILAFEVLEHIEDDYGALKQWRTLLKTDGALLMSTPAHPKRWDASDIWAGHFRRYERKGLKRLLSRAGFSVQEIECYGFPLANILEPFRAYYYARLLKRRAITEIKEDLRTANTKRSGVERPLENKLYTLQASKLGTRIMQFFCALQGRFTRTDLGNGYIVLARVQ
jgi:SAM-dependent methyltransferase